MGKNKEPKYCERVTEQKTNPHAPDPMQPISAKKSAKVQFLGMNLFLEGIVALFATVVASKFVQADQLNLDQNQVWIMGIMMFVLFTVASRIQHIPLGVYFGAVLQLPFLAMGRYVDLMYLVALVFIAIWAASWWLGAKIDRERAEYDSQHPETAPNK